jgi:hypothetical protein
LSEMYQLALDIASAIRDFSVFIELGLLFWSFINNQKNLIKKKKRTKKRKRKKDKKRTTKKSYR